MHGSSSVICVVGWNVCLLYSRCCVYSVPKDVGNTRHAISQLCNRRELEEQSGSHNLSFDDA